MRQWPIGRFATGAAAVLFVVGCGVSVAGREQPAGGIIARLTAETRDQAVACGRAGAGCAVIPYALCPTNDERYSARLATPFSRVALAVLGGGRSNRMNPANVNRWGIGIYVFPADYSPRADAIQRVEIVREGRVISPITTTVGPIASRGPDGATRQLTRGFFTFPVEAFAPGSDITIVFVGSASEATCTVKRDALEKLR